MRQKTTPSPTWSAERQNELFRKLLNTSWTERAQSAAHPEGHLEEAVINEVSTGANAAPPSPEMRQAMRVMDTYTLDSRPHSEILEAQNFYQKAILERRAGKIEEALKSYRAAFEADPTFYAAYNEVGVMLSRTGNLRDALKVYMAIVEAPRAGDHKYIAATNAADIYLTWFDAGRNKERNIERASFYARLSMEQPAPMRACNLLLAYIKDRYYAEAQKLMDTVLHADQPNCPAEKFLQTLFQIRDADLVSWWSWLDGELGKDNN